MPPHPYGWLSILPPIAAIALAIVTRRAFLSLVVGIFVGALITTRGNPLLAAYDTAEIHLWSTFIEPEKLRVFSFTLLMGAMIGVICRNGGMHGLIRLITPLASNRRRGQLTTWLLGLMIFFDDYANTMLLGGALRPVCDRLKISREKLAYLVDSTAAPVAALSLLATWVAVEIDYIKEGVAMLDAPDLKAFDLFVASIPYRFYILMSLVLIPVIAISGRDFGPMLKAERRRLREPLDNAAAGAGVEVAEDVPGRWPNAVLPIAITLGRGCVAFGRYRQGVADRAGRRPRGGVAPRCFGQRGFEFRTSVRRARGPAHGHGAELDAKGARQRTDCRCCRRRDQSRFAGRRDPACRVDVVAHDQQQIGGGRPFGR